MLTGHTFSATVETSSFVTTGHLRPSLIFAGEARFYDGHLHPSLLFAGEDRGYPYNIRRFINH